MAKMNLIEWIGYVIMKIVQFFDPPILRIKKTYKNEITDVLKEGDVILFRGDPRNWLLEGIMAFTNSPYNHAEIYAGDGWMIGSDTNGVAFHPFAGKPKKGQWFDVYRLKGGLDKVHERMLMGCAYKQLAKPYAAIDGIFGFPFPSHELMVKQVTYACYGCSEFVSYCFQKANLPLSPNQPPLVSPCDISYAPTLEYVCSVYDGKVRTDKASLARQLDPEIQSGKPNWLAKWIVEKIMKPLSSRDEFYDKLTALAK